MAGLDTGRSRRRRGLKGRRRPVGVDVDVDAAREFEVLPSMEEGGFVLGDEDDDESTPALGGAQENGREERKGETTGLSRTSSRDGLRRSEGG